MKRGIKGVKNKGILIFLCVFFIVIIVGILLFPKFKKGFVGDTMKVYQPKGVISEKTEITKELIEEVQFPTDYIRDKNNIASEEDILGQISKIELTKNDIITKDKISNKEDKALFSKGNLVGVTVSTLSSSVAGKLKSGDIVKVYGYVKQEGETGIINKVIKPAELSKMEVAYILTSQAKDTDDTSDKNKSNNIPNVVVLKVKDEKQAELLVNLEYSGKIHLEKINN